MHGMVCVVMQHIRKLDQEGGTFRPVRHTIHPILAWHVRKPVPSRGAARFRDGPTSNVTWGFDFAHDHSCFLKVFFSVLVGKELTTCAGVHVLGFVQDFCGESKHKLACKWKRHPYQPRNLRTWGNVQVSLYGPDMCFSFEQCCDRSAQCWTGKFQEHPPPLPHTWGHYI